MARFIYFFDFHANVTLLHIKCNFTATAGLLIHSIVSPFAEGSLCGTTTHVLFVVTMLLLLSGDVETNPGPGKLYIGSITVVIILVPNMYNFARLFSIITSLAPAIIIIM